MKKLRTLFRIFRHRHLFILPKEAQAAIAIARQLSVEELETEKARYQKAADALIGCKVHFRRSCHEYKVEFTVDREVMLVSHPHGLRVISERIASDLLRKHESSMQENKLLNRI